MAAPIVIRRFVTETPLAREHQHVLDGKGRRARAIDWSAFERGRYPRPALALAYHAQKNLAKGEYGAIALFARLASALALNGAPFDLVGAATRIPQDEARHADCALRMAALLADTPIGEVAFEVDGAALEQSWQRPIDLPSLDLWMTELSAINETLAAALLGACRERATDPVTRALFTSIVGDEIHHARIGWYYLHWRAPQWTRADRQRVADRAGQVVADVEHRFWHGRDAPAGSRRAARALGVLDSAGQRAAIRQVMEDEIVPALDALGLGASHAWRRRRRGK